MEPATSTAAVGAIPRRPGLAAPLAVGAAGLACCAVLAVVDPTERQLTPPCPLRTATGWWCPLCGATRATHHLLRLDVPAAFASNVLAPMIVVVVAYAWLAWLLDRTGAVRLRRPAATPAWAPWAVLGAAAVYAVLRNLPWAPLRALAP